MGYLYKAVKAAVDKAASGKGYALIGAYPYCICDQTTADDASRFRNQDEVERWKAKDSIKRFKLYL